MSYSAPARPGSHGRLPDAYLAGGMPSFHDFVREAAPEVLPGRFADGAAPLDAVKHGTTIVALVCDGGVVVAGDRRATMGNVIAQRDIEKVYPADAFSAIGFAGTAGIGLEMVRLFQVELEHYEKLEGRVLSLDGKANRLTTMLRGNLGLAMQGLAVVPLFAGYDLATGAGRILGYDVTGSRNDERGYHSIGSGSVFAKGALKKRYREGLSAGECVALAVNALYDAADDDSATGGPDLTRRIYPVVAVVDAAGYRRVAETDIGGVVESVVGERMQNPGG